MNVQLLADLIVNPPSDNESDPETNERLAFELLYCRIQLTINLLYWYIFGLNFIFKA